MIAAAAESAMPRLYSEDLQDGQVIDGCVTVATPYTA